MASAQRFYFGGLLVCGVLACTACQTASVEPTPPPVREVTVTDAERAVLSARDKPRWAAAIIDAIVAVNKVPTAERVCAVAAVIEQESGFQANPVVKGLPTIVRRGLDEKLQPLGPLAQSTRELILNATMPDGATVRARVDALKTERDLDRLFRDLKDGVSLAHPSLFAAAQAATVVFGGRDIEALNPITTAGSMQVQVAFAESHARTQGIDPTGVRDSLYAIEGGVRFGAARLLDYRAHYSDIEFRFADYNAGVYSSRNAAFQEMLSVVSGEPLRADGDLLRYDAAGRPSDTAGASLLAALRIAERLRLSPRRIREDFRAEKTIDFETSATYEAVTSHYTQTTGKPAVYAKIPAVTIASPKMQKERTTAWFSQSVKRRYNACRTRLGY